MPLDLLFAYAKVRFSHDLAHVLFFVRKSIILMLGL